MQEPPRTTTHSIQKWDSTGLGGKNPTTLNSPNLSFNALLKGLRKQDAPMAEQWT